MSRHTLLRCGTIKLPRVPPSVSLLPSSREEGLSHRMFEKMVMLDEKLWCASMLTKGTFSNSTRLLRPQLYLITYGSERIVDKRFDI